MALLPMPPRPAVNLAVGEDGERQRTAMPALGEPPMHDGQRPWLRWFGQVNRRRDHHRPTLTQQRLVAKEFGQPPRLHADDHHALPFAQQLAGVLREGASPSAVGLRRDKIGRERASLLAGIRLLVAQYAREAYLTACAKFWPNRHPGEKRRTYPRWQLPVAFEAVTNVFALLGLLLGNRARRGVIMQHNHS